MRATLGRMLLVCASTLISASVGLGIYEGFVPSGKAPETSSDFSLAFADAENRPLSAQGGRLRLELAPFTVYRNAPLQKTDSYSIDENGFRGGLGTPGLPRVFVMGGSTVFGQEIRGDDQTISGQLRELVPSHTFINAGVVGYISGQELALMVHHLDRFAPSGYILIDGWNELFDQWFYWPRPKERLGFNNTFFDIENRLHHFHVDQTKTKALAPFVPKLTEETFGDVVSAYLANVERMHAFARARGAFFVWAPQPELGGRVRPTKEEKEALAAWNAAYGYVEQDFSNQYRRLIEQAEAFAREREIPFVKGDALATSDGANRAFFLDPVHLTPAGARALAEVVAGVVKNRLRTIDSDSHLSEKEASSRRLR